MDIDEKILKEIKRHGIKKDELGDWLKDNDYKVLIVNGNDVKIMDNNNKEVLTNFK